MKAFNRHNIKLVMHDCETALETVAARYGLHLHRKMPDYTPTQMPVMFTLNIGPRKALTKGQDAFLRLAPLHGLSPDDLGRRFVWKGQEYVITGIRPRSTKFPIITKKYGTNFLCNFSVGLVKDLLAQQ